MNSPLDGVRVVDLTRLLPGAYCTLLLADLGAEIIKVEDPHGGDLMRTLPPQVGGLSVYHHALNRNKRSITLDLRAPEAADLLEPLLEHADVAIESFRPRTARRLGVSAADLLRRHPRLVHCSLTGFGQTGPNADRAAHDLNFVALSGLFEIDQPDGFRQVAGQQAPPDRNRPPLHVPKLLVADIGSAWAAATGILAALFQRERTGRGTAVDISIHDVAASWLTFPAAAALVRGDARQRLPIAGEAACYNVYVTADARYIALAAIEQKFWQTFCERTGHPEFVPMQFVDSAQAKMRDEVAAVFRSRPLADWLALFADVDVCLTAVNTIAEAVEDAHFAHRGTIRRLDGSRFVRSPIVFSGDGSGATERRPIAAAPALGADTDEVLRAAGIDDSRLAVLRSRGVI